MSNIAEFSVAQFSRAIKMLVEDSFGYVKIRGEVSGFKRAASGHCYFSLKDEDAVLSGVMFKDMAALSDVEIEDGMQVLASGRVTTYGGRSNYQIIVEKVEIAGIGEILKMLEERRKKFEQEGLFDEIHKKELPFFPKKIGVITSQTGAVIQDILHRIEARCPTEITIYNVAVQGKNAAKQVVGALKFFAKMKDEAPDLLIIARGGGSVEDLLPFSDEALVRAAFKCKIPIISAIGHETDFSLLDFVADLRAPTPTAAAEMATIVFGEIKADLDNLAKYLESNKARILSNGGERLANLSRYILSPKKIFARIFDNFRNLGERLDFSLIQAIHKKQENLSKIVISNKDILAKIGVENSRAKHFGDILKVKISNKLGSFDDKLQNFEKLLKAQHYKGILRRGFSLIKNQKGDLISSIEQVKMKEEITVEMHDGEFSSYVFGAKKKDNSTRPAKENDNEIQPKLC